MKHLGVGFLVLAVLVASLGSAWRSELTFGALDDPIRNGSFELDSDLDGIPDFWTTRTLGADDRVVEEPYDGQWALRVSGASGIRKALRQNVRTHLSAGTHLLLSAWSRTEGGSPDGGLYAYQVKILYEDSATEAIILRFPFSSDWNVGEREFVLPKQTKRITFLLVYSDQTGTAWFDLVKSEVFRPQQLP